jgi:hypothetical protein
MNYDYNDQEAACSAILPFSTKITSILIYGRTD